MFHTYVERWEIAAPDLHRATFCLHKSYAIWKQFGKNWKHHFVLWCNTFVLRCNINTSCTQMWYPHYQPCERNMSNKGRLSAQPSPIMLEQKVCSRHWEESSWVEIWSCCWKVGKAFIRRRRGQERRCPASEAVLLLLQIQLKLIKGRMGGCVG